ncbi:MAG: hypothetical protein M3209_09715 [Acidobacteriota bacterium]|nr:hypothetical protein [Acidobacteriota bacterium]
MPDDIFKNFGEFGASLQQYIDSEIDRRVEKKLEFYAGVLGFAAEEERYELSPQKLADKVGCGKDKIYELVRNGALKGCFIKTGTHFKFKEKASRRAIEIYSQKEVYGDDSSDNDGSSSIPKSTPTGGRPRRGASHNNLRQMPARTA